MPSKDFIKVPTKAAQFMIDLKSTIDNKTRVEVFSYAENLETLLAHMNTDTQDARNQVAARRLLLKEVIHDKVRRMGRLPRGDSRSFVVLVATQHLARIIAAAQQIQPKTQGIQCDI